MRLYANKEEAVEYAAAEILEARDTPPSLWRTIRRLGLILAVPVVVISASIVIKTIQGDFDRLVAAAGGACGIVMICSLWVAVEYMADARRHKNSKLAVYDWAEEYRRFKE